MSSEPVFLTLGIFIPGLGISAVLYGVTCAQVFCYFSTKANNDHMLIKGLTIFLWLLNTLDIALVMHVSYFYLVTAVSNILLEFQIIWSELLHSVMVGCATFFVNGYYIWRLWTFSRNALLCIILAFLSTTTLTLALVLVVRGRLTNVTMMEFYTPSNKRLIVAASSTTFITDFLAALSLCWHLLQSRTGFKESDSIIKIVIAYTVNTSLLAALTAFCALITTVALPPTSLPFFFSSVVLPLQINGYLGSLNGRQFFRRWGEAHAQSKPETMGMSSLMIVAPHESSGSSGSETLEDGRLNLDLSVGSSMHIYPPETKVPGKYLSDVGIAM